MRRAGASGARFWVSLPNLCLNSTLAPAGSSSTRVRGRVRFAIRNELVACRRLRKPCFERQAGQGVRRPAIGEYGVRGHRPGRDSLWLSLGHPVPKNCGWLAIAVRRSNPQRVIGRLDRARASPVDLAVADRRVRAAAPSANCASRGPGGFISDRVLGLAPRRVRRCDPRDRKTLASHVRNTTRDQRSLMGRARRIRKAGIWVPRLARFRSGLHAATRRLRRSEAGAHGRQRQGK